MTPQERFLAEGAELFGNRLIYRNKDVGVLSANGLVLTDEGCDQLERLEMIADVVPRPVKRKATKAVEAEAEAAPAEAPSDLDDLLNA